MAELERLVARIEADLTGLRAGLATAQGLTDKTAKGMGRSFIGLAGPVGVAQNAINGLKGVVGALAVRELAQATRSALNFAGAIKDTAKQTGVGVEALQELRYAASQAGLSQETLDSALSKLNLNLGRARLEGGAAGKAFRQIGVDIRSVGDSEQALNAVLDGLQKIEDPAKRSAAAFEIFGKEAGPKFVQLVEQGSAGLNKLREAARAAGAVISEDLINSADAADDKLAALDMVLKAQLTQTLINLAPTLTAAAQGVAELSRYIHEATQGVGIFFARLVAGSDIPFEDDINDATEAVANLTFELKQAEERAARAPTGGLLGRALAPSPERLAQLKAELSQAKALLADLTRQQGDYYAMQGSGGTKPAAAPAPIALPDETLRKQRDLMREIAADNARAGQQLAQQNIARFSDLSEGIKVSYDQALGYSRNYYDTEASLERARHEQQLEAFNKQAEELQLSAADRAHGREQLASTHQGNLLAIQRDGQEQSRKLRDEHLDQTLYKYEEAIGMQRDLAQQLQNFEKLIGEQRYSTAVGLASDLLGSLGKTSRKSFELSKKLAIADAVVNTYRAAAKAIGESSNIYVGLAKAAVALAFGFAQVRAIQATQFGGAGAGGGPGGARTVGGQLDEQEVGRGSGPSVRTIEVRGINPNDLFTGRQLLDIINQAVADGGQIKLAGGP